MNEAKATERWPATRRLPPIRRNLIIVHQPGWQSLDDWQDIGRRVRRIDPSIGVVTASARHFNEAVVARAAELPTLVDVTRREVA